VSAYLWRDPPQFFREQKIKEKIKFFTKVSKGELTIPQWKEYEELKTTALIINPIITLLYLSD